MATCRRWNSSELFVAVVLSVAVRSSSSQQAVRQCNSDSQAYRLCYSHLPISVQVALLGWLLVARAQLRAAGIEAGGLLAEPQVDLLLLAVVYGWQAWLEACSGLWLLLPSPSRQLLQSSHRRVPMAIAALSLLVASRYTSETARSDGELNEGGTGDSDSLGRLQWIDDTYSFAASAATVFALLGALLATDSNDNINVQNSTSASKPKNA